MYCGDETGSFIGDIGSHTSRFGYGGDDGPKYVVPSYVGCLNRSGDDDKKKRKKVLTSCYKSQWAMGGCQSPMRMAASNPPFDVPIVDPAQYLQQGQEVTDWDAYEQIWEAAFATLRVRDRFKHTVGGGDLTKESGDDDDKQGLDIKTVAASGVQSTMVRPGIPDYKCIHPLLAVYPGFSHLVGTSHDAQSSAHRKQMIQMTELCMEKLDSPAVFLAPAPMLAAFAHGRQTALVVDIGAGGTRVTPVVDGFLLRQSQRRTGRGGDWLGNIQWKALLDNKTILRPRYLQMTSATDAGSAARLMPQAHGIFHRWAMQDLMFELRTCEHVKLPGWNSSRTALTFAGNKTKQVVAAAAADDDDDDNNNYEEEDAMEEEEEEEDIEEDGGAKTFEFPDGTLIDLSTNMGRDMRRIPELFFSDSLPFIKEDSSIMMEMHRSILDQHHSLTDLPLHKLINASLSAVGDVDARKDLATSILLTGSSSLFAGLEERLSYEVSQHATYKTKVLASRFNVERSCASWIGGSILTSLGSFQQLWLGRTEYEEYGVTLALQRFP